MNHPRNDDVTGLVKIVVYVPTQHAGAIREAMAIRGAGVIGNYSHNTFSTKGTGRFRPLTGAHPTIGTVGVVETVVEERIETTCDISKVDEVVRAIREVRPYEEPAIDIYPLVSV